ncbi:MAG: hypothetical protein ACREQJ_01980, partial [Candidatus Binatia bacterium]
AHITLAMPRRSGRVRAAILVPLFLVAMFGGCSATRTNDPRAALSVTAEETEVSEDEILSPPYGDEEERGETAEERAGGAMVATLFVGMILALAAVPFLLFGPLGLL